MIYYFFHSRFVCYYHDIWLFLYFEAGTPLPIDSLFMHGQWKVKFNIVLFFKNLATYISNSDVYTSG